MKHLLYGIILLLITTPIQAQEREIKDQVNYSWGFSGHVTLGSANNSSSSNDPVRAGYPLTFKNYADSTNRRETMRISLGGTLWGFYQVNKQIKLQLGISYIDIGFRRTQENIQFQDPLFPGIGPGYVADNSQGSGTKSAEYNYRYQYLQIPIMVNYHLHQTRDFMYNFYIGGGIATNILLDHRISADLYHFTVDGETRFNLDSTGYEARRLGLNILVTAKGEYKFDKNTLFFVQPVFGISPISVSKTRIDSYPYYIQVNAGFIYTFHKD